MTSGYDTWAAGYASTGTQSITENSESGNTVNISVTAYNTTLGVNQFFNCTYTVDGGIITSGTCTQTG